MRQVAPDIARRNWISVAVVSSFLFCALGQQPATPQDGAADDIAAPPATSADVPADSEGPTPVAPGADSPPPKVAVIRVEGMIYDFVLQSIKRRGDRALQRGATTLVIELDTPGGMVPSALKISKYLKSLSTVDTIAWVNNEAYSAGIMVASACDRIIMAPSSATGDCAPIVMGKDLAPTERAKALSPILEEFRDSATRNGYDYAMFHAMCVLGVELYQIEHSESGQRRLVNQADYQVMVKGASLEDANEAVKPASAPAPVLKVEDGAVRLAPSAALDKVTADVAKEDDRGQWKLVKQVHNGTTLLTVNQDRALEMGLSKATISSTKQLGQWLGAVSVWRVHQSWSEQLVAWLVHPAVRAALIMAMLMGAYMEFQSPGLGLPGAVALAALVVLLGAPFLVGLAEVWHVVMFFLGFSLLMVEVLVTPGFAVLGILGVTMMLASLILNIVPTTGLPTREIIDSLVQSLLWTLFSLIASGIGIFLLLRHFGSIPILNRIVLTATQPAGGAAATDRLSGEEVVGAGKIRVGATGNVISKLRPTGRAEIGGQLIDVVSEGQWIEVDRRVRVSEVHGNRIVVEPTEAPQFSA